MAKTEQRLDDLQVDVRAFAPMIAAHAVLVEQMANVQARLQIIQTRMDRDQEERHPRQDETSKESRQWRRALILGSFTVLAAVITAAATVIVAVS